MEILEDHRIDARRKDRELLAGKRWEKGRRKGGICDHPTGKTLSARQKCPPNSTLPCLENVLPIQKYGGPPTREPTIEKQNVPKYGDAPAQEEDRIHRILSNDPSGVPERTKDRLHPRGTLVKDYAVERTLCEPIVRGESLDLDKVARLRKLPDISLNPALDSPDVLRGVEGDYEQPQKEGSSLRMREVGTCALPSRVIRVIASRATREMRNRRERPERRRILHVNFEEREEPER